MTQIDLVLPEGFVRHKSAECPVPIDARVEALILTCEGVGSSGVQLASVFEWDAAKHEDRIRRYPCL